MKGWLFIQIYTLHPKFQTGPEIAKFMIRGKDFKVIRDRSHRDKRLHGEPK